MRLFIALLIAMSAVPLWAVPTYVGYSGAPGRGTCAGSCHGSGGGTIQVSGFPAQYTPGQTYQIIVRRASGNTIRNFNASCRIGTGTQSAGVISAGIRTSTYNTSGETNGVHLSSQNQDTCTFNWQAPSAGTGAVRLYLAGQQGNYSGANTILTLVSSEAAGEPPGQASQPVPADGDTVAPVTHVSWTRGAGTTSQVIHFGTTTPPAFVDSISADTTFFFVHTAPGTTYYWQVNELNQAGVTVGPVWSFSIFPLPDPATQPIPQNGSTVNQVDTLWWQVGGGTLGQRIFFGTVNPPQEIATLPPDRNYYLPTTFPGGHYFWRVDEFNQAGVTPGELWEFAVRANPADRELPEFPTELSFGPAYPNPFNSHVTLTFTLPNAAEIELVIFDLSGHRVGTLTSGNHRAGEHQVQWRADQVPSGIYFAQLKSGQDTRVIKLALLK